MAGEPHKLLCFSAAIDEVELGEAMDVPSDISDCQLCPDAHGQPLVNFTTTSTQVSDACDIDKRSKFRMNQDAEKIEMDGLYQIPGLLQFKGSGADEKAANCCTLDYNLKMKELEAYLELVKNIVNPGCSQEVLNVALNSMSSVVNNLSCMSSTPRLHASL